MLLHLPLTLLEVPDASHRRVVPAAWTFHVEVSLHSLFRLSVDARSAVGRERIQSSTLVRVTNGRQWPEITTAPRHIRPVRWIRASDAAKGSIAAICSFDRDRT